MKNCKLVFIAHAANNDSRHNRLRGKNATADADKCCRDHEFFISARFDHGVSGNNGDLGK